MAFGTSPALAATQGCHTGGGSSAVNVYVEQLPTSGTCHKKTTHHSSAQPTYPVQSTRSGSQNVKKTGKHPGTQTRVKTRSGRQLPPTVNTSAPHSPPPSAVSAAFDLGFGPTALFAALLAVAALLALGGGLQNRRR
jgi:hypothetical protein